MIDKMGACQGCANIVCDCEPPIGSAGSKPKVSLIVAGSALGNSAGSLYQRLCADPDIAEVLLVNVGKAVEGGDSAEYWPMETFNLPPEPLLPRLKKRK